MIAINKLFVGAVALGLMTPLCGMEGSSSQPSTSGSSSSVIEPKYNKYKGVEITPASLHALASEQNLKIPHEAREYLKKNGGLFYDSAQIYEDIDPLVAARKIRLERMGLRNQSKHNITLCVGRSVFKLAGSVNKVSCRQHNIDKGNASAKDIWADLVKDALPTYQTPSTVAYGLLVAQAKENHNLDIEIPAYSGVLGFWSDTVKNPDDSNCVVVQEWVPGTWDNVTPENCLEVTDKRLEDFARLVRGATLWSIVGNLKIRAEDRALGDFDFEQPNNSKSIGFINRCNHTPAGIAAGQSSHPDWKALHNTQVGFEELALCFKGHPGKIDIIKRVVEDTGFLAELKSVKGEPALEAFKNALEEAKTRDAK